MKKLFITLILIAGITKAQIITTVAGDSLQGYSGDNGSATAAELYYPKRLAIDVIGNLYISDYYNNCIRMVNTSGIITTIAGNGVSGFTGDGGQATNAELWNPVGVAINALGNIYIADNINNRIRMVNTNGIITTIAGNGTGAYNGDGGQATIAEVASPVGIALDALGNLYIADLGNNRIRMINSAGIISTVAGTGFGANTTCYTCYSGDGGQATAAKLNAPSGVAFDNEGNMYIADEHNHRIRCVNTSGIINTIAGNGIYGFNGDGGQATAAELYYPNSIVLDAASNLYIADGNNRIRKVNTAGIISTIAGNGTAGFNGDGGQATSAELKGPAGEVLDAIGNLYIADVDNNRIRKITNVGQAASMETFATHKEQINTYPNPAKNNFVIETSNIIKYTLQIFDVTGKQILNQTIQGKTTVDISSLNAGVYNINITNPEGVINKRLIVVR